MNYSSLNLKAISFVLGCVQTDAATNFQHCWRNNVGSCCVCVGSGVQTDATSLSIVGSYSASWEGYNPLVFVNHA